MSTGDPLADAIVGLVLGLIDEGVHALDPVARAETIRAAVEAELTRLHAADPGAIRTKIDAIEQKHRERLTAAARTLRGAVVPSTLLSPELRDAIGVIVEHHDPSATP